VKYLQNPPKKIIKKKVDYEYNAKNLPNSYIEDIKNFLIFYVKEVVSFDLLKLINLVAVVPQEIKEMFVELNLILWIGTFVNINLEENIGIFVNKFIINRKLLKVRGIKVIKKNFDNIILSDVIRDEFDLCEAIADYHIFLINNKKDLYIRKVYINKKDNLNNVQFIKKKIK